MARRTCADCDAPLPKRVGQGRPRIYCDECSPSRRRKPPAKPSPVVTLATESGETCESVTRDVLISVDRLGTPMGMAALACARAIDSGQESGSGLAAVVARLESSLASATSDVREHGDAIDDLLARRRAKLA